MFGQVGGCADRVAIIGGGQPMHDLDSGVLDDVGDQLAGDLFGDDQAFAVRADLGQQGGEEFDGVCGRTGLVGAAQ